ncbi:hypothetical protein H4582DRAFT_958833 [Lactarius indigo]|nr:hypothetical protein H4582DRAFT_958833 [Lactarius indigo]
MASISATVADPPYFDPGEGPSLPHQSVEGLVNWFSSELHSFLSTTNVRSSLALVPSTQIGNAKGPEPARANNHQGQPEGITALATATIPFSGRAIPTTVILSLVQLHPGTGQYLPSMNPSLPPSVNQGGEPRPFFPSHPSHPSHLLVGYPMTRNDHTTIDPRYLEYAPTPAGGFHVTPRNWIPRPEVRYDYQLPGHGDPIQVPIPADAPCAVTAPPGVAVYPSLFNQTFEAYPVSGNRSAFSSSPVNRGDIPPARAAHQNEGNVGKSASRQLGRSYPDTATLSNSTGLVRGAGGDQLEHPSRHRCRECDASYARLSGLNRHYKDKHTAWMACHHCNSRFSFGRKYKFTEHLQTCPGT